ncbi:hypothetical protein GF360_01780 [candidate division WWE3 bacterium]|nr:hypothetical protein [candidate division WWE3 bacterium]
MLGSFFLLSKNSKYSEKRLKDYTHEEEKISKENSVFVGILKKERIPEELQLGDYWYQLYLNKAIQPITASGNKDTKLNKLEVYLPEDLNKNANSYLNVPIQIEGELSWGYAESRIIKAEKLHLLLGAPSMYPRAEGTKHLLYVYFTNLDSYTFIYEKDSDQYFLPGETCEQKIPQHLKNSEDPEIYYYNDSVGIKELGPYKNIFYSEELEQFYQSCHSGGCTFREGTIKVTPGNTNVYKDCIIDFDYELLGC